MSTATAVGERPILFAGPMSRAILEGRKTQTRRAVKSQPPSGARVRTDPNMAGIVDRLAWNTFKPDAEIGDDEAGESGLIYCPFGKPGDRLWVRESWYCPKQFGGSYQREKLIFAADAGQAWANYSSVKFKPSIHMPRWASRITLEITDVRVERLQDIDEADALAEGVERSDSDGSALASLLLKGSMAVDRYARLWDSLNAKRGFGWDVNPWVWALTFKRVEVAR